MASQDNIAPALADAAVVTLGGGFGVVDADDFHLFIAQQISQILANGFKPLGFDAEDYDGNHFADYRIDRIFLPRSRGEHREMQRLHWLSPWPPSWPPW